MNDPMLALDALDRIIDALRSPSDLSVGELSGLYAAARVIRLDLDGYIEERGGHSYAGEKLNKAVWHIGALTGFDITNGHDDQAHIVWALGQASTLRSVMSEIVASDPNR